MNALDFNNANPNGEQSAAPALDAVFQLLLLVSQRLATLEKKVDEIHSVIMDQRIQKEWYSTAELAEAMGKSQYTIQEHWCNDGRIDCEKDSDSGKWRISGEEYRRLVGGGALRAKPR
jgi:hypothetical protein